MTETNRYHCQINLPEVTQSGQQKLLASSVCCIGAGGLAHPALLYLASMGIGTIGIVDGDVVEIDNLNRQILFTPEQIGESKAKILAKALITQNSDVECIVYDEFLGVDNSESILSKYDIVLDCSDNYYTRYLVSDVCHKIEKPTVFAAVLGFEGYITVFNYKNGPCYRCLYPQPPEFENSKNCADFGVMAVTPGLFGVLQANEAIKIILNIGDNLSGELLRVNLLQASFVKRKISQKSDCVSCGKNAVDNPPLYEEYADFLVKEITLSDFMSGAVQYQVIDVREKEEAEVYTIDSLLFPLSTLKTELNRIQTVNKQLPTVIYCAHGSRSKIAAAYLKKIGFRDVYSLQGGIEHYRQEYDV